MSRRLTTDEFVGLARAVHGDRYDYSKSVYLAAKESICIICRVHGEFWQKPDTHIRGGAGCLGCCGRSRMNLESFVRMAREKHGDRYDYSSSVYKSKKCKVEISCPVHGAFHQSPECHAIRGNGCNACGTERSGRALSSSSERFVERARLAHGDIYSYEKVEYEGAHKKVCITCRSHGDFWQTPANHSFGFGCYQCSKELRHGYSKQRYVEHCERFHDGKSNIYAIKCKGDSEEFFKIGITASSLGRRYGSSPMPYEFEELAFVEESAGFIWDLEAKLHGLMKAYRYTPLIPFSGQTECFSSIPAKIMKMLKGVNDSRQLNLIA